MFKGMKVRQVGSEEDDVTLKFRCAGDLETNYDGFLSDTTDAVWSMFENYSTGTVRKFEERLKLRMKVIDALNGIFKDLR